jgi:hypothetical protein
MTRALLLLSIWLPLAACTYASGDPRVMVSSTPAGAEILVDGAATGRTTPSMLDLDGIIGDDHRITLRKAGYEDEHREVVHYSHWYTSHWIDGTDFRLFPLPIWWTLGDFFTPFAVRWQYEPHQLHVKLYPTGDAPVGDEPGLAPPVAGPAR